MSETNPIAKAAAQLVRAGDTCAELLDELLLVNTGSVETEDAQLMRDLHAANLEWRQARDRLLNAVTRPARGGDA